MRNNKSPSDAGKGRAKGPFAEVEALLQAGHLDKAESALNRSSDAGAAPWEAFLWLGRIEERRGRLELAEQAYRKSLSADAKVASPGIEFARFLIARGRFEEAAPQLLRALELGGESGAVRLTLGRVYEKLGRHEDAKRSFLRAMIAAPSSALPRVEFSHFLQATGRPEEARKIMEDAAVKAARELPALFEGISRGERIAEGSESLLALMECDVYRKAFLAGGLRKGGGIDRVEAALRSVLKGDSRIAGARTLLADVLMVRDRLKEAEAELEAAFLPGGRAAETSRIEVLLKLIERGGYGAGLERAVLACLAQAEAGEKVVVDWPQIFSALMCARRYPEAFRLGEAVLDKLGRIESPGQLMWPWWRMIRRAVAEDEFVALELGRIRAAGKSGKLPHWFAYYRAILLNDQGLDAQAMAEYARLKSLDPERYSWMCQSFVLVKLGVLDFDGAIAISRDILSRAPSHWWVRCRMAEAYMARGDVKQALLEFDEALLACGSPGLKGEVLTWHGEVLLWLGEYAPALEKLDAAVGLGAKTFVFGWRGAARLKLGDGAGALSDLDRAVALDPKDFEARGWRAEAYRALGRTAEALEDIEHVIRLGPKSFWWHMNRALLRDALGDEAGMAADMAEVPKETIALVMRKLKISGKAPLTRAQRRKILTSGLEWAKGVRRWENYVQPIWRNQL